MDSFAQSLGTFADIGFGCSSFFFAVEGLYRKAPRWIIAIRLAFLAIVTSYILQEHNVARLPIPAGTLQFMMAPLIFSTILTAGREPKFWRRLDPWRVD